MKNLLYSILYGACYLLSLLPFRALYVLSDGLYPILYYVVRYRRKIVRKNLSRAFSKKSPSERLQIERRFYHFLCDYIFETIKLLSITPEQLRKHMQVTGTEEMADSTTRKPLLFVLLGHFGNWEYVATLPWWVIPEVKCAQLYTPLHNSVVDKLFYRLRSRFGGENIPKKESLRVILAKAKEHQRCIIGFIADQGPKWVNIHRFLPFLGQDTPVFTGTERIARKVDACVYVARMSRPRRGFYTCHYEKLTEDVSSYPEHETIRIFMQQLEQQIEAEPHLWLWTHNRWHRQRTDEDAPPEWKATIQDGQIISDTPIKNK